MPSPQIKHVAFWSIQRRRQNYYYSQKVNKSIWSSIFQEAILSWGVMQLPRPYPFLDEKDTTNIRKPGPQLDNKRLSPVFCKVPESQEANTMFFTPPPPALHNVSFVLPYILLCMTFKWHHDWISSSFDSRNFVLKHSDLDGWIHTCVWFILWAQRSSDLALVREDQQGRLLALRI